MSLICRIQSLEFWIDFQGTPRLFPGRMRCPSKDRRARVMNGRFLAHRDDDVDRLREIEIPPCYPSAKAGGREIADTRNQYALDCNTPEPEIFSLPKALP